MKQKFMSILLIIAVLKSLIVIPAGAADGDINLALASNGATVTTSWSGDGYNGDVINDGLYDASSSYYIKNGQYLGVQLENISQINKVNIYINTTTIDYSKYVEYSLDNENWFAVNTAGSKVTSNDHSISNKNYSKHEITLSEPIIAKYVRFDFKQAATSGTIYVSELEAWGTVLEDKFGIEYISSMKDGNTKFTDDEFNKIFDGIITSDGAYINGTSKHCNVELTVPTKITKITVWGNKNVSDLLNCNSAGYTKTTWNKTENDVKTYRTIFTFNTPTILSAFTIAHNDNANYRELIIDGIPQTENNKAISALTDVLAIAAPESSAPESDKSYSIYDLSAYRRAEYDLAFEAKSGAYQTEAMEGTDTFRVNKRTDSAFIKNAFISMTISSGGEPLISTPISLPREVYEDNGSVYLKDDSLSVATSSKPTAAITVINDTITANKNADAVLIVAVYDSGNSLVSLNSLPVIGAKQYAQENIFTVDVERPDDAGSYTAKAFVFDSLTGLKPLAVSKYGTFTVSN